MYPVLTNLYAQISLFHLKKEGRNIKKKWPTSRIHTDLSIYIRITEQNHAHVGIWKAIKTLTLTKTQTETHTDTNMHTHGIVYDLLNR